MTSFIDVSPGRMKICSCVSSLAARSSRLSRTLMLSCRRVHLSSVICFRRSDALPPFPRVAVILSSLSKIGKQWLSFNWYTKDVPSVFGYMCYELFVSSVVRVYGYGRVALTSPLDQLISGCPWRALEEAIKLQLQLVVVI